MREKQTVVARLVVRTRDVPVSGIDMKSTDADTSASFWSAPWVRVTQEFLRKAESSDRQTGSDERARIHEHPTVS